MVPMAGIIGAGRSGAELGGAGLDATASFVVGVLCALWLVEKIMMVHVDHAPRAFFLSLAFGCPPLAKLEPSARRPARIRTF